MDGLTEEKIEVDRIERERMGKPTNLARQRQQAGNAEITKKRKETQA